MTRRTTPHSAGVLLHRGAGDALEVLLVKPGGPFWQRKDVGAWQIPKGMIEPGETPKDAARREAGEELGVSLLGELEPLGVIRQAGGKIVQAYALASDFDPAELTSNRFECEWPPKSGRRQSFPEVAEARWMTLDEAERMMLPSQKPLLALMVAGRSQVRT